MQGVTGPPLRRKQLHLLSYNIIEVRLILLLSQAESLANTVEPVSFLTGISQASHISHLQAAGGLSHLFKTFSQILSIRVLLFMEWQVFVVHSLLVFQSYNCFRANVYWQQPRNCGRVQCITFSSQSATQRLKAVTSVRQVSNWVAKAKPMSLWKFRAGAATSKQWQEAEV